MFFNVQCTVCQHLLLQWSFDVIRPQAINWTKVYTGCTLSVRLSVCGQNRVCSVSSTIPIGCILYFHILSSRFRGCIACKFSKFKNLKFWQILKICYFDFVLFWLGIQYELVNSMGIQGTAGYTQNAGVLIVLVSFAIVTLRGHVLSNYLCRCSGE